MSTTAEAQKKLISNQQLWMVMNLWKRIEYVARNRHSNPTLLLDEVEKIKTEYSENMMALEVLNDILVTRNLLQNKQSTINEIKEKTEVIHSTSDEFSPEDSDFIYHYFLKNANRSFCRYLIRLLENDKTLTSINASNKKDAYDNTFDAYGDENMIALLGLALKINTTVTSLGLLTVLKYPEATLLASAFKNNKTLKSLVLESGTIITDEAAPVLALGLIENFSVNSLFLNSIQITGSGLEAIISSFGVNKTLTSIELYGLEFNENLANKLAWALNNNPCFAHSLMLGNCNLDSTSMIPLANALETNTRLTSLRLFNNPITYNGIRVLASALKINRSLLSLDLSDIPMTINTFSELASALEVNTSLIDIDLSKNGSSNDSQKVTALKTVLKNTALKLNRFLTRINLSQNQFDSKSASELIHTLGSHPRLTSIDIALNEIGSEGALAFSAILKDNTTLTSLNLGRCKIEDVGAIAIASALKTNKTLTDVNLSGNAITAAGAIELASALSVNIGLLSMSLYGNMIIDKGILAIVSALIQNKFLTTLDLGNNSMLDERTVTKLAECLQKNNTLTSIQLHISRINDNGAKKIADVLRTNRHIILLNLNNNDISRSLLETIKSDVDCNIKLQDQQKYNWSLLSLIINFLHANQESQIKYSILSPIKEKILNLAGIQKPSTTTTDLSRLLDTQFCKNLLSERTLLSQFEGMRLRQSEGATLDEEKKEMSLKFKG